MHGVEPGLLYASGCTNLHLALSLLLSFDFLISLL